MRSRRTKRGETLIEALCAMAIFTVGLLGILGMNTLVSTQSGAARHETVASNLAHDLANAFSRLPYDHPAFDTSANPHSLGEIAGYDDAGKMTLMGAANEIAAVDGNEGKTYGVQWTATVDNDASGKARGVFIQIDVTYPVGNGNRKDIQFETYRWNPAHLLGSTSAPSS